MMIAHVGVTGGDFPELGWWLDAAHGRSSILFATLAGVSVGILTGRFAPHTGLEGLQARTRILVRSASLIAVVGVLSLFNTMIALILAYYAVWFVLALPFVRLRARTLLITGTAVALVGPVVNLYVSDLFSRFAGGWAGSESLFIDALTGTYPGFMWMGFVLVGLGLSKLDLSRASVLVRILIVGMIMAALGYTGGHLTSDDGDSIWTSGSSSVSSLLDGAPSSADDYTDELGVTYYGDGTVELPDGATADKVGIVTLYDETVLSEDESMDYLDEFYTDAGYEWDDQQIFDSDTPIVTIDALGGAYPHSSTPFEAAGSGGFAVAVLALCCLLPPLLKRIMTPVAAVGSIALTSYCLHVLLFAFFPNYFTAMNTDGGNRPLAVMIGIVVLFATVWVLLFGRGPLERMLRWVSVRAARVDDDAAPDIPSQPADPDTGRLQRSHSTEQLEHEHG